MVGINVPIPVPMACSLVRRLEGARSSATRTSTAFRRLHFYTRGKVVTARWPDPKHRGVNLGFPQMK